MFQTKIYPICVILLSIMPPDIKTKISYLYETNEESITSTGFLLGIRGF